MAARRVAIAWESIMDPGYISRPAPAAVYGARAHLPAAGAVKTDLASQAAVQQAAKSAPARLAPGEDPRVMATLNLALRELMQRDIAVRRFPAEATRRLRAYMREKRKADTKDRESDVAHVETIA